MPSPELSVIVPVYDEGPALPSRLDVLAAAVRAVGRTSEILVVDDGSRDGGGARIAAWAATQTPRGEMVVLVGAGERREVADGEIETALRAAMTTLSLRDAARDVAHRLGVARARVYALGLRLRC